MVRYLRAANVSDGRLDLTDVKEMNFTPNEQRIFALRHGDVLVTEGSGSLRSVGASAVWRSELPGVVCFQNTLLRLRPRSSATDSRFLEWWCRFAFADGLFASVASGANIFHLSAERLRSLTVRYPPLYEQQAIAAYLDTETSRIDTLIEKKKKVLDRFAERKRAVLSQLVFGRTSGNGASHKNHKLLGSIPAGWDALRLRHCVGITVGVVVKPSSYFVDDGIPFIHGSNVRDGWIDTSSMKFLSERANETLSKSRIHSGDVIVVRAGYPGRAAIVPPELDGANCASVLILRKGQKLLPEYLCHFMNSQEARTQVGMAQYGAAQEQINVSDIVDFVAPVPALDEQREIVRCIDRYISRSNRIFSLLEHQIKLLAEHRQALVTAAVTGQVQCCA